MQNNYQLSEQETEEILDALTNLFGLLGWQLLEPDSEHRVQGMVVGTPEFLEAWRENLEKRRDEIQ